MVGCATSQSTVPQTVAEPPAAAEITIVKSPNDTRSYRYLKLDNDLTAILVHRPEDGKAGAALAVARGSNDDLPDVEGIAHFLEHMLFLGTEKYPDPDGYSDFITKHGGGNNAYTANELTNYFFDIDEAYFPEGLDRFAQFFVAPLLDGDYVEREKNAVHSEYQMQMRNDSWRGYSVLKTIMNPEHPMSRFNIGSLETLADADRDLAKQYYEDIYSADQMTLIVVSQRSLDELETLVAERFADVPNRNLGESPIRPRIYLDESLPFAYGYKTIMANRSLSIEWPVPDIQPHYRAQPLSYISNLVGHEGEGSLHELLQSRGWINSLSAGGSRTDRGNSLFSVGIGVTESGWKHLDEIHGLVFAYLDSLRNTPIEEWRYQEQASLADLNFQFMEHGSVLSTVNRLINATTLYEPEDVLRGPYMMTDFDAAVIEGYLGYLTRDNAITSISAPDIEADKTEKWFNVPYTLTPNIDPNHVVDRTFELPAKNVFVPDDVSVIQGEHTSPPVLLHDDGGLQIWHATDTAFQVPRAFVNVRLQYKDPLDSASDQVYNALFQRLLNIELNPRAYPALIAGLNGNFAAYAQGMSLTVNGYDDKQHLLLDEMLNLLSSFEIDADQLDNQKTELAKSYSNFKDERPFQQAFSTVLHTLMSTAWAPSVLAKEVDGVTSESLTEWIKGRLNQVTATVLVVGNAEAGDAELMAKTVSERVRLAEGNRRTPTVHVLDQLHIRNLNVEHDDAVYLTIFQGADESIPERAMFRMLGQVTAQAYFNELRTEQQLGYATIAQFYEMFKHPGMVYLVQSPVADVVHLRTATHEFIVNRRTEIDEMTQEEFNGYKQGLLTSLLEEDRNLQERSGRYLNEVVEQNADFNTHEQLAEAIQSISLDDLRSAFDRIFYRDDGRRLEVFSPGKTGVELTEGVVINDPTMFKRVAD